MSTIINFVERNMEYIGTELIVGLFVVFISWLFRQIYIKQKGTVKFLEVFSSYIPQKNLLLITDIIDKAGSNNHPIYFKGSVLKTVIENSSEKNVSVKQAWLVIDEVRDFEKRQLIILGHKKNNRFVIYIVNNGYTHINNIKISLKGNYDVESGKNFLQDEELAKLLSTTVENIYFKVPELKSGEIKQIADFLIDVNLLHEYSNGRDWVYILQKVSYDFCEENLDGFLASIVWNQNRLEVIYCQGGGRDVEKYFIEINLKSIFPKKIELPVEFDIHSNSCKQIQIVTYVNQCGIIKYHFELEVAGDKKIISKPNTVKIVVPIYETSYGYFHILREWLIENEITHYKYNDSPLLQKKIEYRNFMRQEEMKQIWMHQSLS